MVELYRFDQLVPLECGELVLAPVFPVCVTAIVIIPQSPVLGLTRL